VMAKLVIDGEPASPPPRGEDAGCEQRARLAAAPSQTEIVARGVELV